MSEQFPNDPPGADAESAPAGEAVEAPFDAVASGASSTGDSPPSPAIDVSALLAEETRPTIAKFGRPGSPINRGHPFYLGFVGGIGVLFAIGLWSVLASLASVLTLMAVALFLALGLEPVVQWLLRRGLSRTAAVAVVFVAVILFFVGLLAAVVPPLVTQTTELAQSSPDLLDRLLHWKLLRDLDDQYHVISQAQTELQRRLTNGETVMGLFGGLLGASKALVSGLFSAFTVLILTLYFLASMRSANDFAYRLVPASRRARVRLLGDEIQRRVGGYVAGQIAVASINGFCTYILVTALGLPYGLVLALTVGVFGLIPLVGATIGALVVVLVALFDSWQAGVIVAVYYVIYQQIENYVIAPRIMSRTVAVPGAVALIAALAGGALLGILGALVAIPIAAGILLVVQEVVVPRQEKS